MIRIARFDSFLSGVCTELYGLANIMNENQWQELSKAALPKEYLHEFLRSQELRNHEGYSIPITYLNLE
jgi:hypothetical protein